MTDTYTVERSTQVNATPAEIFAHIGDLREWQHWSPWDAMDPTMDKTYSDNQGEVGSTYQWTGNRKVGEGQMTVTDLTADEEIVIDLRFVKPFKSDAVVSLRVTPDGESSKVSWSTTGEKTLMTKVIGIFKSMDKMMGPDFEKGLASLKRLSEAR